MQSRKKTKKKSKKKSSYSTAITHCQTVINNARGELNFTLKNFLNKGQLDFAPFIYDTLYSQAWSLFDQSDAHLIYDSLHAKFWVLFKENDDRPYSEQLKEQFSLLREKPSVFVDPKILVEVKNQTARGKHLSSFVEAGLVKANFYQEAHYSADRQSLIQAILKVYEKLILLKDQLMQINDEYIAAEIKKSLNDNLYDTFWIRDGWRVEDCWSWFRVEDNELPEELEESFHDFADVIKIAHSSAANANTLKNIDSLLNMLDTLHHKEKEQGLLINILEIAKKAIERNKVKINELPSSDTFLKVITTIMQSSELKDVLSQAALQASRTDEENPNVTQAREKLIEQLNMTNNIIAASLKKLKKSLKNLALSDNFLQLPSIMNKHSEELQEIIDFIEQGKIPSTSFAKDYLEEFPTINEVNDARAALIKAREVCFSRLREKSLEQDHSRERERIQRFNTVFSFWKAIDGNASKSASYQPPAPANRRR